jgi:H+/Cl- antiporter ClcA
MKEIISKELLFLFLGALTAIPVSILFVYLVHLQPETTEHMSDSELVLEMDLLIIGGVLGFIGVYIMRLFAWAMKKTILS